MSHSIQTFSTLLATDMNYYAGDPALLQLERYMKNIESFLQGQRADQLLVRVAIHAQLHEALTDPGVQQRLLPFLEADETMEQYVQKAKSRAKFFFVKQRALQRAILASNEQSQLLAAHGDLAEWERENAVLLQHPMFMTYIPSQALLLESAATVALYRQYASIEAGEYTSESSDGEIPQTLRQLGGKTYFTQAERPFEVDPHVKMFNQQVLQNKRVEYEKLRERVAWLRHSLEQCAAVKHLQAFIAVRDDIYKEFGLDRLISLCSRRDKELGPPNEGGIEQAMQDLPADNEFVVSCRLAQYSLHKIIENCHKNFLSIWAKGGLERLMQSGRSGESRGVLSHMKLLQDSEVFRYWLLACITADCTGIGPNKIVGRNVTTLEDYKKFFYPLVSSYTPAITPSNRSTFANKIAERRDLPHMVVLAPVAYSYRENNDPASLKKGRFDLMVYDMSNEKVLLMIIDSTDDRRPRSAFLDAQEERYRFAAVVRSAIAYENKYHGFECSGTIAEYFFDPEQGPEENYYCIMAPLRLSTKTHVQVEVPMKAFEPFIACPPRYLVLGANWGVTSGTACTPFPTSFAHAELNEAAMALADSVPEGYVSTHVLPQLLSREAGFQKLQEEGPKSEPLQAKTALHTSVSAKLIPHQDGNGLQTPLSTATQPTLLDVSTLVRYKKTNEIEDDPLSPVVPLEVFHGLRDMLLSQRSDWESPAFLQERAYNPQLLSLGALQDGHIRTPLAVFEELMRQKQGEDDSMAPSTPCSARALVSQASSSTHTMSNRITDRRTSDAAWL